MTISLQSFPAHAKGYATYFDASCTSFKLPEDGKQLPTPKWALASDRFYDRLRSMNQTRPIGSLPPEILCEIFEVANYLQPASDRRSRSHHSYRRGRPVPITVSQVSAHWREVALEDPLLWTHIDISPPWNFNAICMALSRTKGSPLSIDLAIPTTAFGSLASPTTINSSARILCDIITPHLPQCRSLVIKGDFCQLEPLFVALMKAIHNSKTPLLERLVIHPTGVRHLVTEAEAHSFTHGVPPLTNIRVTSAMAPSLPKIDTLTTLHLAAGDREALSLEDFSTISTSCPLLTTLAIYDDAISGPWLTEATVTFPSLHSLQIRGGFMSVSDLLRVIQAPRLTDLAITPFADNDLTEYRHHPDFSPTKFEALKSFTVAPMSLSGFELLVEAAECFPTVELVMIPSIIASSFREVFTRENEEMIWPRMNALALRNIDCASLESLLPVIAFRGAAGRPLQTLYLDHDSIQRVYSMFPLLPPSVVVLEHDIWSSLRDEELDDIAAHIVGNDFDFVS